MKTVVTASCAATTFASVRSSLTTLTIKFFPPYWSWMSGAWAKVFLGRCQQVCKFPCLLNSASGYLEYLGSTPLPFISWSSNLINTPAPRGALAPDQVLHLKWGFRNEGRRGTPPPPASPRCTDVVVNPRSVYNLYITGGMHHQVHPMLVFFHSQPQKAICWGIFPLPVIDFIGSLSYEQFWVPENESSCYEPNQNMQIYSKSVPITPSDDPNHCTSTKDCGNGMLCVSGVCAGVFLRSLFSPAPIQHTSSNSQTAVEPRKSTCCQSESILWDHKGGEGGEEKLFGAAFYSPQTNKVSTDC